MNHKKLSALLLLLISSLLYPLFADYSFVEDKMSEPIKTPSLQDVQRVKIRLNNGLEALVISDPNTPKSGAALSVGVGQMNEPYDYVGLAHFVEHMLFLGTKEYPVEKEYHEFIQENGGSNNAYTASNQTVYMYEINNDNMSEALHRFSSFFREPLFSESGLSRERQAVDNEFTFRANKDGIRNFLVLFEMAREDHHYHVWRCGTKKTLEAIPREELVKWYHQNYGAEKMKLVVYTAQPLEETLAEIDQNFSSVTRCEKSPIATQGNFLDSQNLGQVVYIEPIQDLKSLSITWELTPEFNQDLDHHTLDLVSMALSEEYPSSLASYLKKKGLVQSLSAGAMPLGDKVTLFQISMELTEWGVGQSSEIIGHCFEAINTLKRNGIPRYRYDEIVNISKTNYHYQSRSQVMDYVTSQAHNLALEDIETYPLKHSWPTKFSADRNQYLLEQLKAESALYMVTAPSQYHQKKLDETEKLAGVPFCREKISAKQLTAWNQREYNAELGIAPPNPYIPSNLELVQANASQELDTPPMLLTENALSTIYFKPDTYYQVPEVYYSLYINSPQLNQTAQSQVLTDLYTLGISDALSGLADQGSVAGLRFEVSVDPNLGLHLLVNGYSEKSTLFLEEILNKLKTHQATKSDFIRYKQKLKSYYENQSSKQQPFSQAMEVTRSILLKDHTSYPEKLEAIASLNYEDEVKFAQTLFDQVYLRAQLYGNLTQNQALEISDFLHDSFAQAEVYSPEDQPRRAILEFDANSQPKYVTETSTMNGNAAYLVIGQGAMDYKKLGALKVLTKSIEAPFYDTLRTKQQTGYIVNFHSQEIEQQLFSFYCVFSNTHSPRDLLARFELFNEDFIRVLGTDEFNEEKFNAIKAAVIEEVKQPPRSLAQKGAFLSSLAFNYDAEFDFQQKRLDALYALTFDEFVEFTQTYLGRQNHGRIAALVEGQIDADKALDYTPILNINNFKTQLLYTSVNPKEKPKREGNGI